MENNITIYILTVSEVKLKLKTLKKSYVLKILQNVFPSLKDDEQG